MQIERNFPLQGLNTLAIAATAEYFCSVASTEDLVESLQYARQHQLPVSLLGGGSNVVLARDLPGLVIRMAIPGIALQQSSGNSRKIQAGAGENWHQLVQYCLSQGWFGLENLSLIPGLVGASPIQNIGAYGVELCDLFVSLQAVELATGEEVVLDKADCRFGYRDSIFKQHYKDRFAITSIELQLSTEPDFCLEYPALKAAVAGLPDTELTPQKVSDIVCDIRRSKLPDPANIPNAGSFFKNPVVAAEQAEAIRGQHPNLVSYAQPNAMAKLAAGWLIEQAGWKGVQRGAVGVHSQQALVLVNRGEGTGAQLLALAAEITSSVEDMFGVRLEIEPRVYA